MEPLQYLWAFLIGGALCAIGQLLISLTRLTSARILVVYVVAGVILGALGLYTPLLEAGGCGASVPLTGFGALLAKGAIEAVQEQGLLGAFTGGASASAGGVTGAIFFGCIFALLAGPKTK